jgi:hypothetical protein
VTPSRPSGAAPQRLGSRIPCATGDAQSDGTGAGLPATVAVAGALNTALGALLAVAGAGRSFDLQFHRPLGGKADYLSADRRRGSPPQACEALSPRRSSVVPRIRLVSTTRPYRRLIVDHRKAARSLQRYGGRASRAASLPPSYTVTRDATAPRMWPVANGNFQSAQLRISSARFHCG